MRYLFLLATLVLSQTLLAVEYYELEVYGTQLANRHELEIENASSMSSDNEHAVANQIFRSTFEFNYGLSERWEATAYFDYTKPAQDNIEYSAFRTHARTTFAEKGEWPVDVGLYVEAVLPRDFRAKDIGVEVRPIFEKDFSRFTFRANPAIEFSHVAQIQGSNTATFDADGDQLSSSTQTLSTEKVWQVSYEASLSALYHYNDKILPHLDYFAGLSDSSALVMPAVDFRAGKALKAEVGVGFGLNSNTENTLIVTRLEYELYL